MEHISGIIKRVMESITVEEDEEIEKEEVEIDHQEERYGHAQLTGQELYDHENPAPLENPMDWEK